MEVVVKANWPTDCEFSLQEVISSALETQIDSLVCDGVLEDYVEFEVYKNI